jgi:glycosyltransferase involved in cell wall biosynthesis
MHLIDLLKASGREVAVLMPHSSLSQQCGRVSVYEYEDESLSPDRNERLAAFVLFMRVTSLGRSRPGEWLFYLHRFWNRSRAFKLALNKSLIGCSAVVVEYTFFADMVKTFASAKRIPMIVTAHDVLAMKIADRTVSEKLLKLEARRLGLADLAVSVSREDRDRFLASGVDTVVIPNSVTIQGLKRLAVDEARRMLASEKIGLESPFVVFFGSDYLANHQARDILRSIAPQLDRLVPGTKVIVAGGCARPEHSAANFCCLGVVSEELKAALYQLSSAVVIPLLQGTGTSLKTIEAFAYGRPVIGTALAFRGLPIENRVHALIEDDLRSLAERVAEVLRDGDLAFRMGEHAQNVAMRFDYRETYRPYIEFLERTFQPVIDLGVDGENIRVQSGLLR